MPKILVIDDKPDNLIVVRAICKKLMPEMQIVTALSGMEGIELARLESPDVILLDIIMPSLDGYEVCRLLKAEPGLSIIPIILLTAILTSSDARVKGFEIGADAFLNKPINENELVAQIKVMLRIKIAEDRLRQEKSELEDLVEERTEVLHYSEQKFRALYENSPLPYHSLDPEGNFVDLNQTWLDLLGYSREEVLGLNFGEFLHPEFVATFNENFPNFKKCGRVDDVHFKIRHHDGHYIDINLNGNIGYNQDGSVKQTYCVFQDISERTRVEQALRHSEEQFRRAVTGSPIPIMIHDEDDNVLQLSKGWTDSSGYTLQEIPTLQDWTKQAYGSASGLEKKYIDELFEIDDTTNNGEWSVTAKDGTIRIWDFKTTPLGINPQGKRTLLSMAVDVTMRKQAEKVVMAEKLFSDSLVSGLPGVFYLISEEGKFLRWNTNFERVTGRSAEEMGQISPVDLFEGSDKQVIASAIKKVFTHGDVQVKGRFIAKDGQGIPYQFTGKKIIVNGAPCLVGLGMDITEQEQTQAELRSKEALITTSAQLTKIGGFEINLVTGEPRWTRGTFLIYGLDPEGPTPSVEDGTKFYPPEARAIIQECVDRAIKEHKPYDVEIPFINASGESLWVRTLGEVEVEDGKTIRLFGAIQDITGRKQIEIEKAEALLEAKKANEVKDQFIANISHEIRTPLNSILGFSDLFKQRYSADIQEKDRVIFDYITDSSERLMHTVDSILNMSMLKSGTISVHKEVINLSQTTAIIANNFRVLAEKKSLSLELIDSGHLSEVFVDRNCINSAIGNLIDNAIKYTNTGGIKLTLAMEDDQACLSISDSGIGIAETYKHRVFEPYTQESEGFTKEYQGVGLGLALTRQFLDLNDVELEMETQKNVGTTFTLTFPKYRGNDRG